ncbi:MAG: DNA primase [Clostridiales bacterium]|nr:DNA primase [Clostridiales bacterium]
MAEFDRFLQELKAKNDIVDVIGSYVALDQKGGNHWACCPFHHERTPSFAVNRSEQFYHCFGCGESGDVIKFVREIESTDFMGAVRILAARVKMEVPDNNLDTEEALLKKKKRDAMLAILLDTARFYRSNLFSGDERADAHLQYIEDRKMLPSTVKQFGIGASLDYRELGEYLAGKGYMRQDILDSGVIIEDKNGRLIDAQAERLIFPIINNMDEVIGFGGRFLGKTDFAKYKNTKETMLFNKRNTLYNINLLKKLKREQPISNVIIVEGYMDTISLYQAGFKNVVASMGTSLTKDQARLIKRYTENVYISYDGDFAGQKADLRGLEILDGEHLKVLVVPMPDGLDPDDVAKQGKDAYQKCLDAAMPLVDYRLHAIERKYDLGRTEEKRAFVKEALKVVAATDSAAVKEDLLKKLRDKTGLTYHSLERDLENLPKDEKVEETPQETDRMIKEVASGSDKIAKAERFILAAKLFSSVYAKGYSLERLHFSSSVHARIAEYIMQREKAGERVRPAELFEVFDESCPEFNEILDLNYNDKLSGDVAAKFFADSIATIVSEGIEQEIALLQAELEQTDEQEKRKAILLRLQDALRRQKKRK